MTRGEGHTLDLVVGDGGLDPDALAWTRAPRRRCNLPARSLRAKRWNSWIVHDRRFLFAAGVADLGLVSRGHAVMIDLAAKVVVARAATSVGRRGCALGETEDAPARFRSRRLTFSSTHEGDTTSVLVTCERFDEGERLSAAMRVAYPPGAEVFCFAAPLPDRGFHYASKHLALPAAGHVRVGSREYAFEGPQALATLDYGRGVWPRRAAWTWASASGWCGDELVGINLGRGWTDGGAATENVVSVDGRLHHLDGPLAWTRRRPSSRGRG